MLAGPSNRPVRGFSCGAGNPAQPSLPPGVSLTPIDGGPDYYASHGFTWTAGWDDPSFFPIGIFLGFLTDQADADMWLDLGINTAFALTTNSFLSVAAGNGISVVQDGNTGSPELTPVGAETVAFQAFDEPATMADWETPIETMLNSLQDARYWWVNFTWNQLVFGGLGGGGDTMADDLAVKVATPDGSLRGMDVVSVDMYWFCGANDSGISSIPYEGGLLYSLPGDMSADECARGCRYGDIVKIIRSGTPGPSWFTQIPSPIPILSFVENGCPYPGGTDVNITPPQMNWAIWSAIIHGARQLCYFNNSFGGPAQGDNNFATAYYQTIQPGQAISVYDQAKTTNALIRQLAPVINAPFAAGYFAVTPPPVMVTASVPDSGIDAMAKYYGGRFWIFASTRESQDTTGITATFTTAGAYTGYVAVIGESRSVYATAGVFTDTFATGAAVHIYKIGP